MFSFSAVYKATFYRIIVKGKWNLRVFHVPLVFLGVTLLVVVVAHFSKGKKKKILQYGLAGGTIVYLIVFELLTTFPYYKTDGFCLKPESRLMDQIEYVQPQRDSRFFEIVWNNNQPIDIKKAEVFVSVFSDDDIRTLHTSKIQPEQIYEPEQNYEGKTVTVLNAYSAMKPLDYYYQYHIYLTLNYGNQSETESVTDFNQLNGLNYIFSKGEFTKEYYSFVSYRMLQIYLIMLIIFLEFLYSDWLEDIMRTDEDDEYDLDV